MSHFRVMTHLKRVESRLESSNLMTRPYRYSGELRNDDAILAWITKELQAVDIPEVKPRILDSLLKRLEFVAVLYYRKGEDDEALDEALSGLMSIKEEAMLNDIYFVLVSDHREFAKLGGNSIGKVLA